MLRGHGRNVTAWKRRMGSCSSLPKTNTIDVLKKIAHLHHSPIWTIHDIARCAVTAISQVHVFIFLLFYKVCLVLLLFITIDSSSINCIFSTLLLNRVLNNNLENNLNLFVVINIKESVSYLILNSDNIYRSLKECVFVN